MANFATLIMTSETSGLVRGEKALDDVTRAGGRAEKAVGGTERGFNRAGRGAGAASKNVDRFNTASDRTKAVAMAAARSLAAMGGALLSVSAVSRASETYAQIGNSLRAMGVNADDVAGQIGAIGDIAQRTRAPLDATAQLYQRINIAGRDLGASQADVLRFTENVGLALAQQGGSAAQASGALLQLSQAMAGGTVRAEEFNSILEGAFPIAQAAANAIDGAAGSVGKLRNMVIEGEISSREFFDATMSSTDALEAAFGSTVPTVAQAMTVLNTSFTLFVGESDAFLGVSSALANVIISLAENIDVLAYSAAVFGAYMGGKYVASMLAARGITLSLAGAMTVLRGALIRTGIGALVVGAGYLIAKFADLVRATGGFGNALSLLGEVAGAVWKGIVDSAAAIPPGLNAIWEKMRAGFLHALSSMAASFYSFIKQIADGFNQIPGLDAVGSSLMGVAKVANDAALSMSVAGYHAEDAAAAGFSNAAGIITKAFEPAKAAVDKLNTSVSTTTTEIEGGAAATDRLNESLGKTGGAGGKAAKALKEVKSEAEAYNDALKEAALTTEDIGVEKANILIGGIDGVSNAFGDFIGRGLSDFKGFARSILDSFTGMLSQMIAMAAKNRIMFSLGITAGGAPAAAAAAGAPAGGGGGILGLGRLFGGGGGAAGGGLLGGLLGTWGGGSGILGGFSAVTGALFKGGVGNALGAVGANIAGISTQIGSLGAAIGAIAVPVLAVAAIFSFFKKKVTQLDSGLRLTIDGLDTLVETFRVIETKRFWGLSKKVRASYAEAEDEVSAPLQMIVGEIQGSILRAAESLGIGSDAFNDFAHQITVSTQGMSDEDAQQAIQDALEELGDEFASMVEGLSDFQRVSEGSAEAITRMSTSLLAVNDAMDLLGGTLFDVSLRGGDMASFLVDAFGGIEQMGQAVNTYFAAFYSQEEQRDTIMRRLNDRFADLGQIMPQSREGFRQLVESMDLTTEYGQELYAALVSMAGAMDQVLPQVERFTMSMQGLMTRVSGEIGGLIEQSQELASASGEQARLWYRTAKSLREFLMDISNSSVSPLTDSQKEIVNRERFEQALADSLAGNQEAAALLPELAREYLDSAMSQSQTLLEYQAIAAGVMNQLKLAAGVADLEGANEDVTQALYERQIEILTALANFLELESLTDEQLASLGTEIQDLAANWDATIAEFDQALMSLETAIRDAEDFSYSQLQERLNVSVNLLAEADIPEYLKNLIATAETGVEAFIDFVIRDDQLTPDQKWLLANRFSTHFNEIEMALSDQASNSLALKLALRDTFDSLIIFDLVLNPASNKMVEHLATVEQSLHLIGVNVDLSNHPDPLIRALAEYRTSVHEARVRAKITANSDSRALQMVGHRASNHQINAGVDLRGSVHNGIRRMGFRGVSNHKINTGVDLRGSVHDGILRMGFNNTSSHRIKTQLDKVGQTDATLLRMGGGDRSNHRIKTHLDKVGQTDSTLLRMGGAVRSDHRIKTHLDKVGRTDPRILRMGGGDVSNHLVNAGIDLRGSVHTLVRRMGASGKTNHTIDTNLGLDQQRSNPLVRKMGHYRNSDHTIRTALELAGGGMNSTIMQVLNNPKGTYELDMETYFTDQQQDLLDTLLLGPSGTVTIGGQFEFEPSQLFSNWFEGTAQNQIATPMSNLSDMLNELRVAVVLDTQQRQEEMARQDQIANLQRWGAMASDRLQQGVSSAAEAAKAIRDLEKSTNVSLMTGNQMTDLALNPDGTINYDATSVMMGAGSNIAAFNAAFRGPNGLEAQLYAANDSIVAENAMVQELARRLGLLGVIPAFASGGTHMGGVARVGENDMELVAPSRIYNPTETRQMLMGGKDEDVVSELRALRMQFARAEADRKNDSGDVIDYMKKTATTLQKFDVTGLPPERT